MNVRIESTSSDNLAFSRNNIRTGSNDEIWVDAVHDIRIASLADANNHAVLDTDIRFIDT